MAVQTPSDRGPHRETWRTAVETALLDAVHSSHARHMAAGAFAGAVAKTTTAPLDRLKIQFQVSQERFTLTAAAQLLRSSVATDGFIGLWRGHSATLARIIPYAGLHYAAHEALADGIAATHTVGDVTTPPSQTRLAVERFAAGAGAGATATMATYPLDVLRARLAVRSATAIGSSSEVAGSMRSAFRQELAAMMRGGPRTAFRGLGPTLAGIVPYSGVTWLGYTTLADVAAESPVHRLAAGALAGLLGQSVTYPLDVARRRMQVATPSVGAGMAPGPSASAWSVLVYAVRTEGPGVLFKGLTLNWVKGPMATAVSFFCFDALK